MPPFFVYETDSLPAFATNRPKIMVSHCLLGAMVRYDGQSKPLALLTDRLTPWVEWLPICPEVDAGLSVPRPPVQLHAIHHTIRAIGIDQPDLDITNLLASLHQQSLPLLDKADGIILKSRSPSCGWVDTPIDHERQPPSQGSGLFAAAVQRSHPLLPMIDDKHVIDHAAVFITQTLAYQRYQHWLLPHGSWQQLQSFHQRYRTTLLLRTPSLTDMDQWVHASNHKNNFSTAIDQYSHHFFHIMAQPIDLQNAFQVMQPYGAWCQPQKREHLQQQLAAWQKGWLSLLAMIILLRHSIKKEFYPFIINDVLLNPTPIESWVASKRNIFNQFSFPIIAN